MSHNDNDNNNQNIVFAQGISNPTYYSNNIYSYIFTKDLYGNTKALAEPYTNYEGTILEEYLGSFLEPFSAVKSPINVDTGILPPGVRFLGKNYVVFERPPTLQNIFYVPARVEDMYEEYDEDVHGDDEDYDNRVLYNPEDNQITYRIPIPWQLYIATFDDNYLCASVHMYFMNTSLFSTDQILWAPTIPNFFSNGLLCRPMFDSMYEIDRYEKNIKGVIETAYDWVWNNGTNNDLNETIVQLCVQQPDHPILKAIPSDRAHHFAGNYISTTHYFESDRVCIFLQAWESLSIPDILEHPWPNPSSGTHFSNLPIYPPMPDDYSDLLREWISSNYYNDTDELLSSDDIDEIIDNDDYSQHDFLQHLRNEGILAAPTYEWQTSYSYKDILTRIISSIPYGSSSHSLIKDISTLSYRITESQSS